MADQAAYITQAEAEGAKYLLSQASTIKSYCAPCGDSTAIVVAVRQVDVVHTGYEDFWEVQINGEGIDLAYSYFLEGTLWKNIAIQMGIPVVEVPEFID